MTIARKSRTAVLDEEAQRVQSNTQGKYYLGKTSACFVVTVGLVSFSCFRFVSCVFMVVRHLLLLVYFSIF